MKRSIAAILCGCLVLFCLASMAQAGDQDARRQQAQDRAQCQNNLKQLGLVCKMYAGEHRGNFPALTGEYGTLSFAMEPIYPEYMSDVMILLCPSDPEAKEETESVTSPEGVKKAFEDSSFWYLGYGLPNEEMGLAFVEACREAVKNGKPLPQEIPIDPQKTGGSDKMRALKEGIERFHITDINNPAASAMMQSNMPIVVERPGHHQPDGINVLYMDGHVEFIKVGSKYPASEEFLNALEELDKAIKGAKTPLSQEAPPAGAPVTPNIGRLAPAF